MSRRSQSSRPALVLFAFLLLAPVAVAASDDEASEGPMRAGAWAIQFGIGDNFTLNSFSGGAVSVKRHSSTNVAWRAGVSFGLADGAQDRTLERPDTTFTEERDFDSQSIGVDLDRLHYFGAGPAVHPYFGYGPRASWYGNHQSDDFSDRDMDVWSVGLGAVFGAEYRAASAIGIHAEYRASLQYISRTQEERSDSRPYTQRDEDAIWQLASGGVRFGLSAYF